MLELFSRAVSDKKFPSLTASISHWHWNRMNVEFSVTEEDLIAIRSIMKRRKVNGPNTWDKNTESPSRFSAVINFSQSALMLSGSWN